MGGCPLSTPERPARGHERVALAGQRVPPLGVVWSISDNGVLYVLVVLCSAVACDSSRSRVPPSSTMVTLLSLSFCNTQLEGWWTYEFCNGSRLVQRHISCDGENCWTVMLVADSTGGSRLDDGR